MTADDYDNQKVVIATLYISNAAVLDGTVLSVGDILIHSVSRLNQRSFAPHTACFLAILRYHRKDEAASAVEKQVPDIYSVQRINSATIHPPARLCHVRPLYAAPIASYSPQTSAHEYTPSRAMRLTATGRRSQVEPTRQFTGAS
jgi:hypothetical protein